MVSVASPVIGAGRKLLIIWVAASIALLCALFPAFHTTPADVFTGLRVAPPTMYLLVLGLTLLNQLAGAQKWRLAMYHVAGRGARPRFGQALETTALGTFFGQLLPVQVSTAIVRAMLHGRATGPTHAAIGATLHEQLYDLAIMLPAALAGMLVVTLRLDASAASGLMLASIVVAVLAAPRAFDVLARLSARLRGSAHGRLGRALARFHEPVFGPSPMPRSIAYRLGMLSVVRAACMAARMGVIAAVMAPTARLGLVLLGFPAVGIVGALPLTPAGLGVVEWSWSGLLIFAGAVPAAAVVAAVSMRLINLAVLGVIMAGVGLLRVARAVMSPGNSRAPPH